MQITDRGLTQIMNSTVANARVGVEGDGVKVKSTGYAFAWIKSKLFTSAKNKNMKARENFVNKVAEDLGLGKAFTNRLKLETGLLRTSPFKAGEAKELIKTIMKAVELAKEGPKDPIKEFVAQRFEQQNRVEQEPEKRPAISREVQQRLIDKPKASNDHILNRVRQLVPDRPVNNDPVVGDRVGDDPNGKDDI